MKPKTGALIGIFAAYAVLGVCGVLSLYTQATGSVVGHVALAVAVFFAGLFPFAWIVYDRRELGLPRSGWFNIWLAYFPIPATALHLWRSRPRGQRLLPIIGMLGVILGAYAISIAAVLLATIVLTVATGTAWV